MAQLKSLKLVKLALMAILNTKHCLSVGWLSIFITTSSMDDAPFLHISYLTNGLISKKKKEDKKVN